MTSKKSEETTTEYDTIIVDFVASCIFLSLKDEHVADIIIPELKNFKFVGEKKIPVDVIDF